MNHFGQANEKDKSRAIAFEDRDGPIVMVPRHLMYGCIGKENVLKGIALMPLIMTNAHNEIKESTSYMIRMMGCRQDETPVSMLHMTKKG